METSGRPRQRISAGFGKIISSKLNVGLTSCAATILRAEASNGFGLFIRSLAGLDREAATKLFDRFIEGRRLTANQHEFVKLVIDCLTERGTVDLALLYESPFTDLSATGIDGIFPEPDVASIMDILSLIHKNAAASTIPAARAVHA